MKARYAAALALVGLALAVAVFIWFHNRNPLLGTWKQIPPPHPQNGVVSQCGGFDEIHFRRDKVTFISRNNSAIQPPELRNAPPSKYTYPATYRHEGNRYVVKWPPLGAGAAVILVNSDGLMWCGLDLPDNYCFGGCLLVPTDSSQERIAVEQNRPQWSSRKLKD